MPNNLHLAVVTIIYEMNWLIRSDRHLLYLAYRRWKRFLQLLFLIISTISHLSSIFLNTQLPYVAVVLHFMISLSLLIPINGNLDGCSLSSLLVPACVQTDSHYNFMIPKLQWHQRKRYLVYHLTKPLRYALKIIVTDPCPPASLVHRFRHRKMKNCRRVHCLYLRHRLAQNPCSGDTSTVQSVKPPYGAPHQVLAPLHARHVVQHCRQAHGYPL